MGTPAPTIPPEIHARGPAADPERSDDMRKTTRADSGVADALEILRISNASQDFRQSAGNERPLRQRRASSKHSPALPHRSASPRKPSVSSARSSSHSSRPRKSREHPPRRIHSSAGGLSRDNIEDAIAFHERSCQLVQAMTKRPIMAASLPPHTLYLAPATPTDTEKHAIHNIAVTDMQWTCDATRRLEYAAIDRRNKGMRKLLRWLMPTCMSTQNTLDFYDEANGSDAGSVRRYRLKLSDEKN